MSMREEQEQPFVSVGVLAKQDGIAQLGEIASNSKLVSLSVVLPAYNEEAIIGQTVSRAISALSRWTDDFEIVVVNDGSKDSTKECIELLAQDDARVRLVNHPINNGYGAALVTGFRSVKKDLVFFMDSDGQFDINDLERFLPLINEYDAILGYRDPRQDTWLRKFNAWGWKQLVRLQALSHRFFPDARSGDARGNDQH